MASPFDNLAAIGQFAQMSNPGGAFNAGMQGAMAQQQGQQVLAANQIALEAARTKAAREAELNAAVSALDPTNARQVAGVMSRFPEVAKELKSAFDVGDEAQSKANLLAVSEVWSAAASGNYKLAAELARKRYDADKAAGHDNPGYAAIVEALESGDPEKQRQAMIPLAAGLAATVGPDKFAATFGAVNQSREGKVVDRFLVDPVTGKVRFEAPLPPQYRTVGENQSLIEIPGGGDPASSGGAPSGGGGAPLSIRLNNPGAIRVDPANKWQGQVGSQNGFVEFATPEDGARAHRKLIANQIKAGFDTPLKWAEHYAPASDGNDPLAYAKRVADGMGIGVNDKIPLGAVPKMAAISAAVESGGSPSPSSGGARVIAQGAPRQGYRLLTPQEVAATPGLDPSIPYQVSPQGQISPIAGTSGRTYRQIPNATSEKAQKNVAVLDALNRTLDGFRDNFGGNTITGGLENKMQALFGTGTPGQREWWADFYNTDNIIRNQLFGSALTEHEKKAYEDTTISPRMSDDTIRKNLSRRRDIIQSALGRQAKFLKANKYDPEAVDALFQTDALAGANLPRVRSIQEAMKLPKGTVFLTPDGRRKVR